MELKIDTLKGEEYDEFMQFLEKCYRHTNNYFQTRYPHVWRRDTINFENRIVLRLNGKIVSHVGLFPLTMIVNKDTSVRIGGIGGVATLQEYRGRGYMTKLLNYTIEKMKREGYPLSVLWGSWTRYTHFGYENAGRTIVFTVSKRSLRESSEVEITRFRGQESLLEKIIKWREREPVYIKRSKRDYKYLLGIPGLMVYLSDGAYIAYRKEGAPDIIIEHGHNGNAKELLDTIYTVLSFSSKEFGSSSTRIIVPYYNYDTFTELFKYSTDWSIVPNCMAKILNLQKLLESYKPYLERKRVEYKVTLSIPGENVTLEIADRRVKITPGKNAGNKVVLNERDMVKLLFVGPETVGLDGKIKEIFPLPLFLWPLDHI